MRTTFLMLASCLSMALQAQIKAIPFGSNSVIEYNLGKGVYNVVCGGRVVIKDAYAVCMDGDHVYNSTAYPPTRAYVSVRFSDSTGSGILYGIHSSGGGMPAMHQFFYVYKGENHFYTQVALSAPGSEYMSPLTTENVNLYESGDNRALLVPFDNDAWVRYNALPLSSSDFTAAEATALYNNTTRHGLVLGSVEHRDWKTGIRIKGKAQDELSKLSVFGGYTDKAYTHDTKGHGRVKADKDGYCKGPKIMVGWFDDWRTGLETYAALNRHDRYISKWTRGTPMGWNSWGAMQDKLTLPKAEAVADFFHDSAAAFRSSDKTLYLDLDSYWDLLLQGGLDGDYGKLKEFCRYCERKGLQPGVYWAPFVDWGKSARKMEGGNYNYEDCWIRQHDSFVDLDGARALDPTHPGTQARIALVIKHFKDCGFKMIKIDFLGHATLEADHYYDSTVHTGMQAFRKGMEYLIDQLDGRMLVYAAISPNLATARYVHMRRIACDAYSSIGETAYTLNSTTYGWWLGKAYDHIDADHIVFKSETAGMNRARLASALVTGTLIMGDDYSVQGQWHQTAKTLLQNRDLLEIVHQGQAFRPVEGNTGDKPGNFFISRAGKNTYLALFNYSDTTLVYTIEPQRWGIQVRPLKELFSGTTLPAGALKIVLPPADAVIYRME